MTDYNDFFSSDDYFVSDPTSPFYGLPAGDVPSQPDPNEQVLGDVLDRLGIPDFSGIFVDFGEVDVDRLRGNRFVNITDAIVYLAEAGILQFGDVTIDEDDNIGTAIDDDTGRVD